MFNVHERDSVAARVDLGATWRELVGTIREISGNRPLWMFLLAYWLYIDGVNTVIKMAVDFGLSLGLAASSLLGALLLTQFVAFPAAIAFGHFGTRFGARRAVLFGQFVPSGKSAEYFGFYNLMGKFATVLGPVLVGATAALTGSNRTGISSLLILFVTGGVLLWKVRPAAQP
jgi:UMF1 family MFS transporter